MKYELDHWTDRWIIRTNDDGAVDFKLARSRWPSIPSKDTWIDVLAHNAGRLHHGLRGLRQSTGAFV